MSRSDRHRPAPRRADARTLTSPSPARPSSRAARNPLSNIPVGAAKFSFSRSRPLAPYFTARAPFSIVYEPRAVATATNPPARLPRAPGRDPQPSLRPRPARRGNSACLGSQNNAPPASQKHITRRGRREVKTSLRPLRFSWRLPVKVLRLPAGFYGRAALKSRWLVFPNHPQSQSASVMCRPAICWIRASVDSGHTRPGYRPDAPLLNFETPLRLAASRLPLRFAGCLRTIARLGALPVTGPDRRGRFSVDIGDSRLTRHFYTSAAGRRCRAEVDINNLKATSISSPPGLRPLFNLRSKPLSHSASRGRSTYAGPRHHPARAGAQPE